MKKYVQFLVALFAYTSVFAQSPQAISYQAELRNTDGTLLINQDVTLLFTILEGSPTGSIAYEEFHEVSTSSLGKVALEIGRGVALPTGDAFDEIPWGDNSFFLEVSLNSVIVSNTELVSVPFAFYALESGSSAGDFELPFSGTFDDPASTGAAPSFQLSNTASGNNDLIELNMNGNGNGIQINNNNPNRTAIDIDDNGGGGIIIGTDQNSTDPSIRVTNDGNDNAIFIQNEGDADALFIDVSGAGRAANFGGAVLVSATLDVNENLNVGDNVDIGDNLTVEDNLNVGGDTEIEGELNVSENVDIGASVFVDDDIEAGGILIVEGLANIGGNLVVQGNLSKGGGSFKIDHPLDPYNKYLYHSFVESPDMMNIYNGIITTNENGVAQVSMPDWFTTLNMDFRYQLTLIGAFGQAIIKDKMNDLGSFTIETNIPNAEVSWQVTGIRNDTWAQQNRIPVEEEKSFNERGTLLHSFENN